MTILSHLLPLPRAFRSKWRFFPRLTTARSAASLPGKLIAWLASCAGILRKLDHTLRRATLQFVAPTTDHSCDLWRATGTPLKTTSTGTWKFCPQVARITGFEWASGFFYNPVPPEIAALFAFRLLQIRNRESTARGCETTRNNRHHS